MLCLITASGLPGSAPAWRAADRSSLGPALRSPAVVFKCPAPCLSAWPAVWLQMPAPPGFHVSS